MLGPSGSGKTTVLRLIAGFELPTSGTHRAVRAGRHRATAPFDRDVNTVFQDYALFPHMTVLDNVAYGLRVRGIGKQGARASARAQALAAVRLEQLRRPQARPSSPAASASASPSPAPPSSQPKVLLLDEPLGALDLKLREQMQVELKEIQRELGITFIFVTHDQEEALTSRDRIAVFNDGRIEQLGTPREIYEQPGVALRRRLRRHLEPLRRRSARRQLLGRAGEHSRPPREADAVAARRRSTATGVRSRAGHRRRGRSTSAAASAASSTSTTAPRVTVLEQNDRVARRTTTTAATAYVVSWHDADVVAAHAPGHLTRASAVAPHPTHSTERKNNESTSHASALARGRRASRSASVALLTACGTSSGGGTGSARPPTELGEMEGAVSILAWPGYVEDGSNDPAVDWVTPFEEETGCKVTSKTFGTSDEAVSLMKTGEYDVVAASGDASLRLDRRRRRRPVNTDLIPNYDGHLRLPEGPGVELGRRRLLRRARTATAPTCCMYNTDVVTPAPTSWDVVFDKAADYTGKVTAYDSPIYIADAAVYLMAHQPDLGIRTRTRSTRSSSRPPSTC